MGRAEKGSMLDACHSAGLRLVERVAHWPSGQWQHQVGAVGSHATVSSHVELPAESRVGAQEPPTRADVVYELVQQLADYAAQLEGGPRRTVPRLASNVVLADQLGVMVNDLAVAARAVPQSHATVVDQVLTHAHTALQRTSQRINLQ